MCTCTDHSRRIILLTEHASREHVQDFDVAIRTLNRTTLITRRTWHRCNRQRLTLSVFVVCKFRTDSVFIVQDTRETNTSLDLTQTDSGKKIETDRNYTSSTWQEASLSRSHLSIPGNQLSKHRRMLSLHRRSYYHKKAYLGRYCTLLVASKRTSSDFYGKKTIFSLDKAENTETVYMYVYTFTYFSLTLALSSPLQPDVLACHRETRWYSDNAGVVCSVAGRR